MHIVNVSDSHQRHQAGAASRQLLYSTVPLSTAHPTQIIKACTVDRIPHFPHPLIHSLGECACKVGLRNLGRYYRACSVLCSAVFSLVTKLNTTNMPRIILTGFYVFEGVDRNPTEDAVRDISLKGLLLPDSWSLETHVLDVSVEAVSAFCRSLASQDLNGSILLHLGVDCRTDQPAVKLEKC